MADNNEYGTPPIKLNIVEHPQRSGPRAGVIIAVIAVVLVVVVGLVMVFGTAVSKEERPAAMQNSFQNGYLSEKDHAQTVPEHTEDPGGIEDEQRAVFSLASSVEAGQIAVINAENISDPSRIELSFTPTLQYKGEEIRPVFFGENGTYSALVPIPADCFSGFDTSDQMTFWIDVRYGNVSRTLDLVVFNRSEESVTAGNASITQINNKLTDANLITFESTLSNASRNTSDSRLWGSNEFFSYYDDGFKYALSYGGYWKIANGAEYRNESLDFKAKGSYNIVAVNSGVVVAAGENEYLGKYICIDHGMGLQSWYLHLSEVYVAAGDTVEAVSMAEYDKNYKVSGWGKAIGRCATTGTGFVEDTGIAFSVMYTVYGVPVCPYSQRGGASLESGDIGILAFN